MLIYLFTSLKYSRKTLVVQSVDNKREDLIHDRIASFVFFIFVFVMFLIYSLLKIEHLSYNIL